jgi:hypothetical protein
VAGGHGQDG